MKKFLFEICLLTVISVSVDYAYAFMKFPVVAEGTNLPEKQDVRWIHVGRNVELGQDGDKNFFRLTGSPVDKPKVGYNYYSLTNFSDKFGTLALDPSKDVDFSISCRIISDKNLSASQSQGITIYYGAMDDGEAGSYLHNIRFMSDKGMRKVEFADGSQFQLDWDEWHTYKIHILSKDSRKAVIQILDDKGNEVFKKDVQADDSRTYSYSDVAFGDTHSRQYETIWEISSVKIDQPRSEDLKKLKNEAGVQVMPVVTNNIWQFFLDDYLIADTKECKRKIITAKKYLGNPVLVADKPWEYKRVSLFGSVLKENGIFRMWYFTGNVMKSREKGSNIFKKDNSFVCYATSKDGIHWIKPNLGIYEFKGSKANNIVMRHHGSHLDSICILKASWEKDPSKKYKMTVYNGTWPYAGGYKKLGYNYPPGHYLYYSADGIHWTMAMGRPILYLSSGDMVDPKNEIYGFDASTFCVDEMRKKYVGFIKRNYRGKRSRYFTESDDAIRWTKPRLCLHADSSDPKPETQMYYNSGWPCTKALWLGLNLLYYPGTTEAMIPELVYSRNGKDWHRSPVREEHIIPLGPEGSWDSKMISIPSTPPIQVGDELYIYYGGYQVRHDLDTSLDDVGSIGLAFLKKNRFAAIVAENQGVIQTKSFECQGGLLEVNCNVKGVLKVEVLHSEGKNKVISGYSVGDCVGVTGDFMARGIRWKSTDKLPAGKIALRFIFNNAEIYGFKIVKGK